MVIWCKWRYRGCPRNALYLQQLRQQGKKLGLGNLGGMLIAGAAGAILAARSSQLADVLALTEIEGSAATAARNELVSVENRVLTAREFFADVPVRSVVACVVRCHARLGLPDASWFRGEPAYHLWHGDECRRVPNKTCQLGLGK